MAVICLKERFTCPIIALTVWVTLFLSLTVVYGWWLRSLGRPREPGLASCYPSALEVVSSASSL